MQNKPSYVHGTDPVPLSGDTIGQAFDRTCDGNPDGEALVVRHQSVRWTWRMLRDRVDRLAAGFIALGLEPGDRIGIWAPNNAEWVMTQYASAKAGLVLVNINPAYRIGELEYALKAVGCKALITAAKLKSSDYISMLETLLPEVAASTPGNLRSSCLPDLKWIISLGAEKTPGMLGFSEIAEQAEKRHFDSLGSLAGRLQFDDPINIQFTSGTTGTPKAATLTHHNILNNAFFVGRQMEFTPADRLLIPVPMYHCFGMVLGTLLCMVHGATAVLSSESFDPRAVLETIEVEECTALHGVPTMFLAELEHPDFSRFDLTSLRTGIIAGAPCPVELMKRLIGSMDLEQITIAYGMTETGPVSFQTSVRDTLDRRVETVGTVLPHIEIKITDEHNRVVPRDQAGELKTRGYCVMPKYWNDPEKTAQAIDQAGWIASGDIATIDAQGYCRIVGRIKDMLIRGGENIYPREIEEFLYTHPKIDEVEVIGVPDAKFGEAICAWIKLRKGEAATAGEIQDFCKGRIAHFKIPRFVRFVTDFPMTVTGKVQKFKMREIMEQERKADVA